MTRGGRPRGSAQPTRRTASALSAAAPPAGARGFVPLQKQREFMEATEPELLYSGAVGAGKSRTGCEKGLFLSTYYPGNVGLIVRKVFADLTSTTLETLFNEVLPERQVIRHNKSEHRIVVQTNDAKRPSTIWYRGLDRESGIRSMNLGWIFVDEGIELDEKDWATLESRLRWTGVPFHQLFTCTNPDTPTHWLHKRFYPEAHGDEMPMENGQRVRRVIETNALENPHLPKRYVARLRRFHGIFYDRFVLGKWVGLEGLIYPEFDPFRHIIDPVTIPDSWPGYMAIDFGTTNPFVALWAAEDPADGTLIVWREIYRTNRRAYDHGRQILSLEEGEPEPEWRVSDHDRGDRMDLESLGIFTRPAYKDIGEGIQAVKNRLAARVLPISPDTPAARLPPGARVEQLATGERVVTRPGILFVRNMLVEEDPILTMGEKPRPTSTLGEPGSYRWAKSVGGAEKDEPASGQADHGMDAVRYLVMARDRGDPWGAIPATVDRALSDILG